MAQSVIFSIDSFFKNNIFYKNYCLKRHSMLAKRVITADIKLRVTSIFSDRQIYLFIEDQRISRGPVFWIKGRFKELSSRGGK